MSTRINLQTTFDVFVSVLQVAGPRNILPVYIINIRWNVTYINGTFTLYYSSYVIVANIKDCTYRY